MKKQLLLLILLFSISFTGNNFAQQSDDNTVVVCTGKYATKYHKTKNCKGLNNCKGELVTVKVSKAKDKGMSPCKICF